MYKGIFVSSFFLFFLSGTFIASAQTNCLMFPSGSTPPAQYGASYGVLHPEKELLVSSNCPSSGNTITLQMGKGGANQYVWGTAYTYENKSWVAHTLSGQSGGNGWLISLGTKAVTVPSNTNPERPLFFAGYVCSHIVDKEWKCGCRDKACTTRHWQLQGYTGVSGNVTDRGTGDLPTPAKTVSVSSSLELSSAIADAGAGTHIVLANGNYSGFTVSKSGQSGKPIVIRAANKLGATVSGDITISGNYAWVVGVDVIGGGAVKINGAGDRISSSRLRSIGPSVIVSENARSAIIDHNEIDSQAKPTSRSWFGVELDYVKGSSNYNHVIARNYFHGAPPLAPVGGEPKGDDNSAIGAGTGQGHSSVHTGTLIEYNLFDDWKGDDETIAVKSGGNTIQFNTITRSNDFNNRHGNGNRWIANWVEGTLRVHDKGNTYIGNRVIGGAIEVHTGDITPEDWDAPGTIEGDIHPTADDTTLIGNKATVIVGDRFVGKDDTIPVHNTRVEANDGVVNLNPGFHINTTQSVGTSQSVPTASKLTTDKVGPFAPTSPRVKTGGTDKFTLAPSWSTNWAMQKIHGSANLEQTSTGVNMVSGPVDAGAMNGIAMWSKNAISGNVRIEFDSRRLGPEEPDGLATLLYFYAKGKGTSQYPASYALWPQATQPDDTPYTTHGDGLRFTFANKGHYVRLGYFNQQNYNNDCTTSAGSGQICPQSPDWTQFPQYNFPMYESDATFHVRIDKIGSTVTVSASGPHGTHTYTWTNAKIGSFTSGYIGMRQMSGRSMRIENFTVTEL